MNKNTDFDKDFKPFGTIAFVVILLALTALAWFSIYFLQLDRHA
ncbi:hypothetical protein [Mucilaginibacter psychrotolerans]|nr:hypothetical protein [Mucilaginibacter psychrotolerans]